MTQEREPTASDQPLAKAAVFLGLIAPGAEKTQAHQPGPLSTASLRPVHESAAVSIATDIYSSSMVDWSELGRARLVV